MPPLRKSHTEELEEIIDEELDKVYESLDDEGITKEFKEFEQRKQKPKEDKKTKPNDMVTVHRLFNQCISEILKLRSKFISKEEEEIDELKKIYKKLSKIDTDHTKWKIFYLFATFVAGITVGAVIASNWESISPHMNVVLEFIRGTNNVSKMAQ